eukprot:gene24335-31665_t
MEQLFGETLYQWSIIDPSSITNTTTEVDAQIKELPTIELLKNKDVIAVYFSASWCGPCQQFTPQLVQYYVNVKKSGKKFEIIWVSRDRTSDEFVDYYTKMPWLAVPVQNLQAVVDKLSPKYNLKGIPHLVFIDGVDGSIYTTDGRLNVMKDKYGVEYPYQPKTIINLLPSPIKRYINKVVSEWTDRLKETLSGLTVNEAIHAVFTNYCPTWKSNMASVLTDLGPEDSLLLPSMDSQSFARMIRDSPGLAKNIGRTEVDLIFSSVKPVGARRMRYEHFLMALLELAIRIFPEADPTTALSNFLSRFIFSLFDQPPAPTSLNVIDKIYKELLINNQGVSN